MDTKASSKAPRADSTPLSPWIFNTHIRLFFNFLRGWRQLRKFSAEVRFASVEMREGSLIPLTLPKVIQNGTCSATTLAGSTNLPFVISTEAKRSGEISVWMLFLGDSIALLFPVP
jgi:hypothetical protein